MSPDPTNDDPTDGSSESRHPDFEVLSAHFDGEAPEVAAHVAGCAECRRNLRWLRTASDLVATPVPAADPSVRNRAIAAAVNAFENTPEAVKDHDEVTPRPVPMARPARPAAAPVPIAAGGRTRGRRSGGSSGVWIGIGSAAAVVVAVLVGVGVLAGGHGHDADTTVAAGPTQERTTTGVAGDTSTLAAPTGAGGAATADASEAAGGVDGGDLGDIADAAALAARAGPVLAQRQARVALPDVAPTAGIAPSPVPKAVGTRPCEMEARTARPGLGTVVYYATGRVGGVPVVVLGFAPAPAPAPVILLALAQPEACRIVLEAAGP
ncbi:MAG: hypothetical protein QOG43_566 [Actinomycetota bacterium]|jgi:hypothetical protein|nr:hypothetical protein [Actinomycetota bacterium]